MSNMVVATNVLALNSHRSMKVVGTKQARASARLSSGYRINSAADDAAGLSISEKMRAQIRGLNQASKNAQDGISLVQTAEGGMQEIDNMIQRMRELVVQAANDTNDQTEGAKKSQGDRRKIQDELNQLGQEIDSMAERVEFNQKKVINGEYQGTAKNISIQNAYQNGKTTLDADQATFEASEAARAANLTAISSLGNNIKSQIATAVGDMKTALSTVISTMTAADRAAGSDVKLANEVNAIIEHLTTGAYGQAIDALAAGDIQAIKDMQDTIVDELDITAGVAGDLGFDLNLAITTATATDGITGGNTIGQLDADAAAVTGSGITAGDYAVITDVLTGATNGLFDTATTGVSQLLADQDTGAFEELKDVVGTQGSLLHYDASLNTRDASQVAFRTAAMEYQTADKEGGLYLQTGANARQGLEVSIGSVKTDMLGIGNGNGTLTLDVVKASGKDITDMLDHIDQALTVVTTERSRLGAVQNRLEYTINSLDISAENLSASESRIRDADMAKEMMALTQANILQQAAISMLAQANQAPQSILQLLG